MRRAVCLISTVLMSFSVQAQFLDVNKIGVSQDSRSVMFQEPQKTVAKKVQQPQKKAKVVPKKDAQVTNVSFFKPGDAKIMAIVNGEAISSSDIESYAKLFMLNTGVPLNNKTKPMIINKVLQTAIDEKIKKQEAEKNQITVSDKDLVGAMNHYENVRKMPKGSLQKLLKQKGINEAVFKQQIKTEILWARLVRRKMAAESYVTQREVEDAIKRSQEDMSSPKYRVSEIVIPAKKAENIEILVENIRRDKVFNMYAAQFSQSPSASTGGNLGWLKEGQLPQPLEAKIKKMQVGQVSEPIKYDDNFYILKLDDKFIPGKEPQKISFDEMKSALETERLEGFSAKYLQNLRQKSIIEFKG